MASNIITIQGRLSFPTFTHAAAVALNQRGNPKFRKTDENEIRPGFDLLLSQGQQDILVKFLKTEFFPWCADQPDGKSHLDANQIKKLTRVLDDADWEVEGIVNILRPISEKTKELAPERVASTHCAGPKGGDITQKAKILTIDELADPDEDIVIPNRGVILPYKKTTHDLYAGSICAATLNLWAVEISKSLVITASTSECIFLRDGTSFSTAGAVDEDAVLDFEDDDDDVI